MKDFLVLKFIHVDRNNNQVAQSLRPIMDSPNQCTHFIFAQKNVRVIRVNGDVLMSSTLTPLEVW